MNDGDLGDNITHHAEVAESQLPREYRFQNDDAHLEPRRVPMAAANEKPLLIRFTAAGGSPRRRSP